MDKLSAKLEATGKSISVKLNTSAQIKKLKQIQVTPTSQTQVFIPDGEYNGFSTVTVNPIPSNYGKVTYNGQCILIE